jgi:hypothetical protein
MADEAQIRASFAEQAGFCTQLGAPFTALLCETLGKRLDRRSEVGRRVLGWAGDPGGFADAVALRLCGGLHFLARSGSDPQLARLYPPAALPDEAALWAALAPALTDERLAAWLDHAPQTNEVGRSAVLMSGLLVIANRFDLPMRLYELGASAGLNLQLDLYGYELGGLAAGEPASGVQLRPEWVGPPPPAAKVMIAGRRGTDLNPARLPAEGDRLLAYVWPDQPERLQRLAAALAIAAGAPPEVDRAGAADWLETQLALAPEPGVTRVVMHSVAFQYFDADSQKRVTAHIEAAGERASAEAPLAWLRYEQAPKDGRPSLRLRTWPGGEQLLAWAHPHGRQVRWLADD